MIRIPGKFRYAFNPRTGSRAMEQAFLDHIQGAQDVGRHHGLTAGPEPLYATLRDPATQVMSYWWHLRGMYPSLEQYIANKSRPRLNLFADQVTRYFIYEDGLEGIFEQLGYPGIQAKRIGGHNPPVPIPEVAGMIRESFPEDWILYNTWAQRPTE